MILQLRIIKIMIFLIAATTLFVKVDAKSLEQAEEKLSRKEKRELRREQRKELREERKRERQEKHERHDSTQSLSVMNLHSVEQRSVVPSEPLDTGSRGDDLTRETNLVDSVSSQVGKTPANDVDTIANLEDETEIGETEETSFSSRFIEIFKTLFIVIALIIGAIVMYGKRIPDARYKTGYREIGLSMKEYLKVAFYAAIISGIISAIVSV